MASSSPRPYPSDPTDEQGALIEPMVPVRPGGRPAKHPRRMAMPSIVVVWADGGYAGKLLAFAQYYLSITVQIVKRTDKRPVSEVLPRGGVVERTCPGWCAPAAWLATTDASPPTPRPWSSGPCSG